jgi:hypothetical protein
MVPGGCSLGASSRRTSDLIAPVIRVIIDIRVAKVFKVADCDDR